MRSAVVVFPASNCDRDAATALESLTGKTPHMVWHQDSALPEVDLVVLPGGFSYGDYLRCGAMASQSAVMRAVKAHADKAARCWASATASSAHRDAHAARRLDAQRGAQIRLPLGGAGGRGDAIALHPPIREGQRVHFPVAHGEGNYFADGEMLNRLEGENRVVFRYADGDNPNGSARNIAGILNEKRNVLGLMPHPERVVDPLLGGTDGVALFKSLIETLS